MSLFPLLFVQVHCHPQIFRIGFPLAGSAKGKIGSSNIYLVVALLAPANPTATVFNQTLAQFLRHVLAKVRNRREEKMSDFFGNEKIRGIFLMEPLDSGQPPIESSVPFLPHVLVHSLFSF